MPRKKQKPTPTRKQRRIKARRRRRALNLKAVEWWRRRTESQQAPYVSMLRDLDNELLSLAVMSKTLSDLKKSRGLKC